MADPYVASRKLKSSRRKAARASDLLARAAAYRDAADAKATVRAYQSDYSRFESWCSRQGFTAMPPAPDAVAAYLASDGEGYALSTLRRRVAAIAHFCRLKGYALDTQGDAIRGTLRGIARKHGRPPRRAAALTTDDVQKLCNACGDTLSGIRDRALLLVGFAGALRRSELVALDVEHVKWTPEGMILLLERSKTDKEADGAEIAIVNGKNEATCAVTALRRWLEAAEITTGPIFRKISTRGRVVKWRFSTDAVRRIVRLRAAAAHLKHAPGERISPHGLRAGFVTTAYRNGVRDEEIMEHTRHKRLETMRGYIRRAKLGNGSPSGKIGL